MELDRRPVARPLCLLAFARWGLWRLWGTRCRIDATVLLCQALLWRVALGGRRHIPPAERLTRWREDQEARCSPLPATGPLRLWASGAVPAFARLRLTDGQRPSVVFHPVQVLHGFLGLHGVGHLDKAKAP